MFEDNDRQVILVKNPSPSNPTTLRPRVADGFVSQRQFPRPSGSSSNGAKNFPTPKGLITGKPVTGAQRQQTRFGGKGNPTSAGGGASQNDGIPRIPEIEKEETLHYDPRSNYQKKKKQSAKQCELNENGKDGKIEIVSRIKEDAGLVRAAEETCKNTDVQKDVNHLEEQLAKGNDNPVIGRKPICKGVIEHRGKNGGRLYVRESDGVIEILAKSGKKKSNQQFVINRLKEIYG